MKLTATEHFRALGFTDDRERVELELKTVQGEPVVIEFPVSALGQMGLLSTQVAQIHSTQMGAPYRAPSLAIAKWSIGHDLKADLVIVQFDLQAGGAYGVNFSHHVARDLLEGLTEAVSGEPGSSASVQ